MHEDFVDDEPVEFEVDGKKFSYKPVSGGEDNDWLNEYMSMDEKGKVIQDFSKLNKCKTRNIKSVPYNKDDINGVIGVEKEWDQLNIDARWNLLYKLKGNMFTKIFDKINKIDNPIEVKKNNS